MELEFEQHLILVSKQKDGITQKLKQIFKFSLKPTSEEESIANKLKEYGNPPGKRSDPIGDQLSWVQLLNKLRSNDRLIIITLDKDYASIYGKKSYINSKLHFELEQKNIDYFVYSDLSDGIKKFEYLQDKSGLKIEKFPSEEELEKIKKEETEMDLQDTKRNCKHANVKIRMNGIFDEWACLDCNQILFKHISDDID